MKKRHDNRSAELVTRAIRNLALVALSVVSFIAPVSLHASEDSLHVVIKPRLLFKTFGYTNYGDVDVKPPCTIANDAPEAVFEFLLKWTLRDMPITRDSLTQSVIRDICVSEYMPLGKGRYLVLYRGIGIVNTDTRQYSRLLGQWVYDDSFLELHQLKPSSSTTLYRVNVSKGELEGASFYAFFFHEARTGDVSVQYAELTGYGASHIDAKSGDPYCPDGESGESLTEATSLLSPSVETTPERDKATFSFVLRAKNCKTGVIRTSHQYFIYKNGRLKDQKGRAISIENLEHPNDAMGAEGH